VHDERSIRLATPADYDVLGQVMYDAVRRGPSAYSPEQRKAWAPQPRTGADWYGRLRTQTVFVAEDDDTIVGFMSLADGGYIDLAFVRPDSQGTGLFRRLFEELLTFAQNSDVKRLRVHASLTAQPAFSAMGFHIVREETVERGGQLFSRFEMDKALT